MKKILFSLVALVCSMSMNAQIMKVMKGNEVVGTYIGSDYEVVFEEAPELNTYESFFGTWEMTYENSDGDPVTAPIVISGPTDVEDEAYNKVLTAKTKIDVGALIETTWHMHYTFDEVTKKGTLSINHMEEMVGTYSTSYHFWFALSTDNVWTAEWELDESGKLPNEVVFPEPIFIYYYDPSYGWFEKIQKLTINFTPKN